MNPDKETPEEQDVLSDAATGKQESAESISEEVPCNEEVEAGAPSDGEDAIPDDDDTESSDDDEYEFVELELNDEDIVCYLEDEEGNRVGFVLIEDDEEVEYFYVEGDDTSEDGDEIDFGITKEGVARATSDMNDIYRDGAAVAGELKAAFDDIKQAFDFSAFTKK